MSSMREFFLDEAAACVDRISVLFQQPDAVASPEVADELRVLTGALRDGARTAELDVMFDLADLLDGAVHAMVAGSVEAGPEATEAVAVTLAALRACIAGEQDADAVRATADRWSQLGVGAEAEADPPEVLNFFREEARAVLARLQRIIDDAARTGAEAASDRDQLRAGLEQLRDTAHTFGFGSAHRLASEALDVLDTAAAIWVLEPYLPALDNAVDRNPAEEDLSGDVVVPSSDVPSPAVPGDGVDERPGEGQGEVMAGEAEVVADENAAPEDVAEPPARDDAAAADSDVVPVEAFWYRGEAALRRALELEPVLRDATTSDEEARAAADEVFDLIRLALPEEGRDGAG